MSTQFNSTLNEGQSINRSSLFNGENYTCWKARMRIFIQASDYNIWSTIVNDPHILTHMVENIVILKSEKDWNNHDRRMA